MPKSSFIDFKIVKAALSMEAVLEHYALKDSFKRSGDSLSGPCPIHQGSNPTQFRVSVSKNIWNCFGECKHGGNVLDFIARMEKIPIHAAAKKAIEWFNLDPVALERKAEESGEKKSAPPATKPVPKAEDLTPNPPLKFRLDKLERDHPYLSARGLSLETIIDFGIGFCGKGIMAGRIAVPIHNLQGEVVAYAGRLVTEPDEKNPKYKLPPGFRKSLELFNCDRAFQENTDEPLVIVEGFFDCMKIHQHGHRKVVALMGSTLSAAQEALISQNVLPHSRILIILDEDEAGRAGREDAARRLSRCAFVRVHTFYGEGTQPEDLAKDELDEALGNFA